MINKDLFFLWGVIVLFSDHEQLFCSSLLFIGVNWKADFNPEESEDQYLTPSLKERPSAFR